MNWPLALIASDVQAWREYAHTVHEINAESKSSEDHAEENAAIQAQLDAAEAFLSAAVADKPESEIYGHQIEMWIARARTLEIQLNKVRDRT